MSAQEYKLIAKSPNLMARSNKKALLIVFLTLIVIGIVFFVLFNAFLAGGSEEKKYVLNKINYQEIEATAANELIKTQDNLVILGFVGEFEKGHLPGALNVQRKEIEDNLDKINKDQPILVYADYKVKSVELADILAQNSFSQVYRLKGEYQAWVDAGQAVETGSDEGKINDLDGDGLDSSHERELGSNPLKKDTDSDGLADCQEEKLGTSLTNKDTDGDGYDDREELETGHDPLAAPSTAQKKSKVSEEISLWSAGYIGEEGKAVRYLKEGEYFLEIESLLVEPQAGYYYEVYLMGDNLEDRKKVGKMEPVSQTSREESLLDNFQLRLQTAEDLYSYVNIFVVQRKVDSEEESVILRGEFDQE